MQPVVFYMSYGMLHCAFRREEVIKANVVLEVLGK